MPDISPIADLPPVLGEICRQAGLDDRDARLLRRHVSTVILLPRPKVVVRLVPDHEDNAARAHRAVTVAPLAGRP